MRNLTKPELATYGVFVVMCIVAVVYVALDVMYWQTVIESIAEDGRS